MHEPQRLLARFNPITVDWQNCIPVTGAVLRAEDIAAGLAGLARGPYLLMRYLWCQDKTDIAELHALLLNEVLQIAKNHNWACKGNMQRLTALMKMALYEFERENHCKPCKGTGVKTHQTCAQCNGKGKKRRSQAEYARLCGVKANNWQQKWAYKYHEIYLLVSEWNEIGMDHLLTKL